MQAAVEDGPGRERFAVCVSENHVEEAVGVWADHSHVPEEQHRVQQDEGRQRHHKVHEILVVVATNRVAHKWAVVVESCHTLVGKRVVFRPDRFADAAGEAKVFFHKLPLLGEPRDIAGSLARFVCC